MSDTTDETNDFNLHSQMCRYHDLQYGKRHVAHSVTKGDCPCRCHYPHNVEKYQQYQSGIVKTGA